MPFLLEILNGAMWNSVGPEQPHNAYLHFCTTWYCKKSGLVAIGLHATSSQYLDNVERMYLQGVLLSHSALFPGHFGCLKLQNT